MVEPNHNVSSSGAVLLQYTVGEYSLISKTGSDESCEDAIYIGPYFVAVIDGATSKTERRWNGQTGGKVAAQTLRSAFDQIPFDATAREAVNILSSAIQSLYRRYNVLDSVQTDPVQRAVATFVAVSFHHKEVWFVGDCQCLLNQKWITNTKEIDNILSSTRSFFLETEIAQGKTVEELLQHDTGRDFILPLLKRQMYFQNTSSMGQYWFSVIDGFDVPDEGIRVQCLPTDIETIVLASDGYPTLADSLEESEQVLREVLREDPLLFRKYKSTKGVKDGDISFDDRAYVKLRVKEA